MIYVLMFLPSLIQTSALLHSFSGVIWPTPDSENYVKTNIVFGSVYRMSGLYIYIG